jgi:hypothetical protein
MLTPTPARQADDAYPGSGPQPTRTPLAAARCAKSPAATAQAAAVHYPAPVPRQRCRTAAAANASRLADLHTETQAADAALSRAEPTIRACRRPAGARGERDCRLRLARPASPPGRPSAPAAADNPRHHRTVAADGMPGWQITLIAAAAAVAAATLAVLVDRARAARQTTVAGTSDMNAEPGPGPALLGSTAGPQDQLRQQPPAQITDRQQGAIPCAKPYQ